MATRYTCLALFAVLESFSTRLPAQEIPREEVIAAMQKAATYYRTKVASHGGYVYYYSAGLERRWGEGKAGPDQIWVQPPGTPTVGMAYLKAYSATGDLFFLDAARETAEALVYGQLEGGGWTNAIDFDPAGSLVARYRKGGGTGKNNSTLDDGITQAALRFLMHADRALKFKQGEIHEASEFARKALLAAQFPSGGFPQVWTSPVTPHPVVKAQYPEYDWRTENRIKNYWDLPTLNDGLAGTVAAVLIDAWEIYKDESYRVALERLGDFLLLAQMPDPQPGWAQQYDYEMRPVWARRFEPPAIAGRESQDVLETLLLIHRVTRKAKYLEPIAPALAYLQKSLLSDGMIARYYELNSNKPLYMTHDYALTYDDSDVPQHYGWKTRSHLKRIEEALQRAKRGELPPVKGSPDTTEVHKILTSLDPEGRWISTYLERQPLVGQSKFQPGEKIVSSEVFCANLNSLSDYLSSK